MLVTVDESSLALCVRSPKDKYKMLFFFCEDADGSICKCFPAVILVRTCLMCTYGKGGIEQQYALFCPACQIAGCGGIGADIIFYLFEDVEQGGRKGDSVIHGEAQSVCLSRTMIPEIPLSRKMKSSSIR